MPNLIFQNLGIGAEKFRAFLLQRFSITSQIVDANVVIDERDASRAFPFTGTIKRHRQISLDQANEEVASQMISSIEILDYEPETTIQIRVPENFGLLDSLVGALQCTGVEHPSALRNTIAGRLLPAIRQLGAAYVTPVTVNLPHAQAVLSLLKIMLLTERFGWSEASTRTLIGHDNPQQEPFAGVIPNPFDLLTFVDTLTIFPPIALTLSAHRLNCAWHFQNQAMWQFHRAICNGMLSEFGTDLNPLSLKGHLFGLNGLRGMNERNIWRYLTLVTEGVDRLFGWLGNPINFQRPDGTVDLLRQIQAFSGVHLFFADVAGLHRSSTAYNRVSYSLAALDKLANLRRSLGAAQSRANSERNVFCRFIALSQADNLKALIRIRCRELNYEELETSLIEMVDAVYKRFHDDLSMQGAAYQRSESSRADRLWSLRNARHGTYLDRQQFETLFMEASGTVPSSLATVPFLLCLGLILDPQVFFSFSPEFRD